MRRSVILVFLFLLLLTACNTEGTMQVPPPAVPTSPPTATPQPQDTPTPAPTATPTEIPTPIAPPTIAMDTSTVKSQAAQVEADTAKMRGLKPKQVVPEHFISQEEMKYNMTQYILKEYTHEEARRDVTRLWLLMFIDDPTMDFRQLEIEFAGTSILGYYDDATKEMFVRTDQPTLSPQSRQTLSHEFVHMLQDQHFDLQKLLHENVEHDQMMAVKALIEGDATISGVLYSARYMTHLDFWKSFESEDIVPPMPGRAPVYLEEAWQFPYREGSQFIFAITAPGNFKPVDAAFADPPQSSEQIMHPEKYLSQPRDVPLPVALPPLTDTLGVGWTLKDTDTLGEFDLDIMLRENYILDSNASEGWGGARYDLYENGDDALVIMGTRWDTKKDATEWEEALTESFKAKQKYDPYEPLWHDLYRSWGIKRSGEQIMFVSGTKLSAVRQVLDSLAP